MKIRDFKLKFWWHGLVEDLYLACEKELFDLEEPVRRNVNSLISPNHDLPSGWRCLYTESLTKENKNPTICDSYHCLYDSLAHKAIRSRYAGKIFQRRLSFFQPVILSVAGLLGIASFILQLTNN